MESAIRLGEAHWIRPVGIARTEAYWLEGRLDAAISELDRVRSSRPVLLLRRRLRLQPVLLLSIAAGSLSGLRRLAGTADAVDDAVDIEPFASQLAGDGARAAMLWDRLGCPYQAALALLDTKEETHLRESLDKAC